MKKLIFILTLSTALFIVACKSKQKTTDTNTKSATETVSSSESLLKVAQTKYPGITQSDLDEGKNIFTTACVKCHGYKKPTSRSEEKWVNVMNEMAPKARLGEAQKKKVLEYVLSTRANELANQPK